MPFPLATRPPRSANPEAHPNDFSVGNQSSGYDGVSDRIRSEGVGVRSCDVLARVRRSAGLSQEQLARAAGTSRTAVSAYEHGRKSPSLDTVDRLLGVAGYELDARPQVRFSDMSSARGRPVRVPTSLPRLPVEDALAAVELPLTLNWSQPGRVFRLSDRVDRARVYELVMREGNESDVLRHLDGALLVDLWEELVLPEAVRWAWLPLIEKVLASTERPGGA